MSPAARRSYLLTKVQVTIMAPSQSPNKPQGVNAPAPPRESPFVTLLWIPVAALGAWLLITLVFPRERSGGLQVGTSLPSLAAASWLNGSPPDDLAGKVVVLDAWGSFCLPCAVEAPHLVE